METKESIDITVLIIIATMGIMLLVFAIVFLVLLYQKRLLANKTELVNIEKNHQKELMDAALDIAERERQKIATNLHDDIGIILNVLKMNLDRLKKNRANAATVDKIIADSNQSIDNSLDIVRDIYRDIVPPTLKHAGLVKGLKELGKQLNQSGEIEISFESNEEVIELDKSKELQLYRLIKEVINNTLKHAKPTKIHISIKKIQRALNVSVAHNGQGINTEKIRELAKDSKGIGLKSILTRSELINATIDFSEIAPGSAMVVIRMLLNE